MPSNKRKKNYHHGDLRRAIITRAADIIEAEGVDALSLRRIARDIGVSHGAPNKHFKNKADLLAALATEAYEQAQKATIAAANACEGTAIEKLNAMGCGYLSWALDHPALFTALNHPDVKRSADKDLLASMRHFQLTVRDASIAAQAAGRHPDVDPKLLALYNNSVPFGAALLIDHPVFAADTDHLSRTALIEGLMQLVIPTK